MINPGSSIQQNKHKLEMAFSNQYLLSLITISLYFSISLAFFPGYNNHFMEGEFPNEAHPLTGLCPQYYQFTCPQADQIVISVLKEAIAKDPRMAASILRLHFHDCFVQVTNNQICCTNPKLNNIKPITRSWIHGYTQSTGPTFSFSVSILKAVKFVLKSVPDLEVEEVINAHKY